MSLAFGTLTELFVYEEQPEWIELENEKKAESKEWKEFENEVEKNLKYLDFHWAILVFSSRIKVFKTKLTCFECNRLSALFNKTPIYILNCCLLLDL